MKVFEKIYIEISDYCALSCGFCPSGLRQTKRGEMDLGLFKSICEQIQGKAKRVCLHILGDPLGVGDFAAYVRILAHYGLKVDLVSTGLFLKERDFELLLQNPFVQVSFSLSAFLANANVLKMAHLHRILDFCGAHIQRNAPIFINLRFHQNDIMQESEKFKVMLETIRAYFGLPSCDLRQGRIKLAPKIFLNPMPSFEWEQSMLEQRTYKSESKDSKPLCYGAHKQFGILSNGELVPCCIDYNGRASFGNVRTQSMEGILDSVRFLQFAQNLKDGIAPCELCEKCGYKMIL